MGYFVADTDFTQKHLYGLLADVLFEASFFGVEQEHLAEERRKLDESIKEIEEGKCVTYSMDEFREHLGLEKEDVDEEADGLWHKLAEATFAYERYCRNKELDKLKESIME